MTDPLRDRLLAAYADEHRDHLAVLRAVLARGGGDLEEAYRHAHSLKGAARAVDLSAVVELAHQLESLLETWWESGAPPPADAVQRAREAVDAIEDLSAAALGGGAGPAAPEEPPDALAATVRVEAASVDRLVASTARLSAEVERRRAGAALLRQVLAAADVLRGGAADALRLLEDGEWAVGRATDAVVGDVARLRLVTAEVALGQFGPMLRALAAEQGKDVRYDAYGLATQADREVLTTVAEAVMHLLSNAVAHGIEPPAERAAAGKDPVGRLTLAVAAIGPRLEITVSDDGAGIPLRRLAAEAVGRGLLSPEQAAGADPDRLRQLVFHPGLSTAEKLSTTAGRGMGMAVVRRVVERLQGQVVLRGRPGGGTEAQILVPVSVLAQRVVLVRAGAMLFGLPAVAVRRLATVTADDVRMVDGRTVAVVGGTELPLVQLAALFGLSSPSTRRSALCVAVLRTADEEVALVVDAALDVRDLWVSPLDDLLLHDPRLAGTVTLEGGVLMPVLSPTGLGTDAVLPPPTLAGAPRPPPLVLVVDDSLTARTLERTILEANSYRVEVAVDGQDALDRMVHRLPDVVVSDIEMPRLDGLGLLAIMRADPRLASVPVVLVTSCSGEGDRKAGMALGAAAYLLKTRFDQREFLDTIGRLTT